MPRRVARPDPSPEGPGRPPGPRGSRRARDTVHLSFSGGEARGYAHIGCLQAVERLGLRVTEVSGSSIGALAWSSLMHSRNSSSTVRWS